MKELRMSGNDIRENLAAAGCDHKFIECFAVVMEKKDITEQLELLTGHRVRLLKELHEIQIKIDCLDYLIIKLKK